MQKKTATNKKVQKKSTAKKMKKVIKQSTDVKEEKLFPQPYPKKEVMPKESEPQKKAKEWGFNVKTKAPYDPLLGCLLFLAKMNNKPSSAQALTAGLALVNNKLTPDIFTYAAARAGFSAKIVKKKISEIPEQQLPVILFLKNEQACLLTNINENSVAKIVQPESGGSMEIPLADLEKDYVDYAVYVKPSFDYADEIEAPREKPTKHWFWSVMKRGWPIYNEVLVASFLINIFTIASPLFVMNVYDRVVPNAAITTLWVLAIGVIIVFGFDFVLRNLRAFFIDYAGRKIDVQLSKTTFQQIMDLEMAARPNSVGTLANTVHAFEAFRDFITSATVSLLVDIPFVFLFLAVIGMLGGAVVLVPIVIIPLVLLVNVLVHVPLTNLVQESHQHAAQKQAVLFESLAGVETIKGMRAEGLMQNKWEHSIRSLAKLGVKLRTFGNIGTNFSIYSQHMAVVGVVIVGVYKISAGNLTVGGLIACVILTGRTLAPISQIAALLIRYKQSRASLNSLDTVMKMPVERPAEKTFLHRPKLKGAIEFRDVNFNYPNQIVPALEKISFKINPGERVGIVGRTGSGKTTVGKLILKFYQPNSGSILIDGTDIHQLDPAELRHNMGYIPQEVVLFNGSIRDNIVIGAPFVDDRSVIRAAQLSGIDTFVNRHPEGFDRQIFERGQNLSGGQRQAIAIARASILDPPIFIFDEPCNAMDDATIAHFFGELSKQLLRKTLILVTHRGSLLKLVDRLIVIDSGRLIIDGPKQEILQKLMQSKNQAEGKP